MIVVPYKIKKIRVWTQLVRPTVPATAITLDKSSIKLSTEWQTSQITATLTPADSTSTVSWTSSNTSIATVSSTWLVTCVTPWTCTITATTNNGLTASCSVMEWWYTPWAYTVAYFPLKIDLLDHWPNQYSMTNYWWVTIDTTKISGKGVAYFNWSSMLYATSLSWLPTWTNPKTMSCRVKNRWSVTYGIYCWFGTIFSDNNNKSFIIWQNSWKIHFSTWWWWYDFLSDITPTTWQRYNVIASYNWSTYTLYINWTSNRSGSLSANTTSDKICIWWNTDTRSWFWMPEKAYISEVIIENKAWTAQEVQDYYNLTKSQYSL